MLLVLGCLRLMLMFQPIPVPQSVERFTFNGHPLRNTDGKCRVEKPKNESWGFRGCPRESGETTGLEFQLSEAIAKIHVQ
ncbi:hypothetical protein KQX54_020156 [Cotesia glomerata]|uniref:Secreted protein n=1 Tax=Cotesia glomerata TaxID=32391 RepID=A0AAV7IDV4_COTGL|nr:hypothetical protein KQX54_020156 [Cotesia glomerata]